MKNRDRISVVVAYQVDRGLFPWLFSSASEQTTPYRTGIAPSAHSSTLRHILTFCIPLLIPSRAALVLGCTRRTINRLIIRYHQEGKAAFRHGNKGRKPAHTIPDSVKESIFNCTKTTILMPILPIFRRFWNSRNISVFLFQPWPLSWRTGTSCLPKQPKQKRNECNMKSLPIGVLCSPINAKNPHRLMRIPKENPSLP